MNVAFAKEIVRVRPRTLILVALLVLIDCGLFVFVALYQMPRLAARQEEWFSKRQSAAGATAQSKVAAYRKGESDLQLFQERILPKRDFTRYVGNLFETAKKNSLTFKGVSYKVSPVKGENLIAYAVDLNVAGTYPAIKSFIADLGRRREIMTIDNLSLSGDVDSGKGVALKVQLTVYLRMEGQ